MPPSSAAANAARRGTGRREPGLADETPPELPHGCASEPFGGECPA
ncbi:hypothetical protein ACIQMY_28960 [Streptomyces sp. NPDC091368]